jgi:solute carrier family 25 (mitochondrial citrate transporter), member 1
MVTSDTDARKSPLVSLIAGGLAGGIECTVTYPFEFAKTRVQLKEEATTTTTTTKTASSTTNPSPPPPAASGSSAAAQQQPARRPPTNNPISVIRRVIAHEGPRALYKGCSTMIVGTIGKDALRFIAFDSIKDAFKDPATGTLSPLRNLLAGISSGVVASTLAVTPTERIKTALIDDARGAKEFASPWGCVRELVRRHGWRTVYKGYVTTTLKQGSSTAVRLGVYNILKDFEKTRRIPMTAGVTFANGAVAGLLVVVFTQPFDTLKTRAQSVRGVGVVEAWGSVVGEYGVRGLWRGSTMRMGRTVLAGGILFTSYEAIAEVITPILGKATLPA